MARPSHSDQVLQQLNNQRECGFLCDCCIAIGDVSFLAHKALLAACSAYFRMVFIQDQQEAVVRLDLSNMQISAESFNLVLQLMYGGVREWSCEFEELRASMTCLQMYDILDSLDDLRDIQTSNVTPCQARFQDEVSEGAVKKGRQKIQQCPLLSPCRTNPAPCTPEAEQLTRVVSTPVRPSAPVSRDVVKEEVLPVMVPPPKSPSFGHTYTCDDCEFVFGCEDLLTEHILTCTSQVPRTSAEADDSNKSSITEGIKKAESSTTEGIDDYRVVCKYEEDWPKCESRSETVIRSVASKRDQAGFDHKPEAGISDKDDNNETMKGCVSSSEDSSVPAKVRKIKVENQDPDCTPCVHCGAADDQSANYISNHMYIWGVYECGKCKQVRVKKEELQENLASSGEPWGAESSFHGEDDSPLLGEPQSVMEVLPHRSMVKVLPEGTSESPALEHHALACHEQLPSPALLEEGVKSDHLLTHICSICNLGFDLRCHLQKHSSVHMEQKHQFPCQACGKRFQRERQLRSHRCQYLNKPPPKKD